MTDKGVSVEGCVVKMAASILTGLTLGFGFWLALAIILQSIWWWTT